MLHEHNLDDVIKRFLVEYLGYRTSEFFISLRHTIAGASKTLSGGIGAADIFIESRAHGGPAIVIESKTSLSAHAYAIETSEAHPSEIVTRYALEGAHHYARQIARQRDVISMAISGDPESPSELRVTVDLWYSGDEQPFTRDFDGTGLIGIRAWDGYLSQYSGYGTADTASLQPLVYGFFSFKEGDTQEFEARREALVSNGISPENIFSETWGQKGERLAGVCAAMRPGDRLVVEDASQLGRRAQHLPKAIENMAASGFTLEMLTEGAVFSPEGPNHTGSVMMRYFKMGSEIDAKVAAGKTKEALTKAKEKGRVMGRKPLLGETQVATMLTDFDELLATGERSATVCVSLISVKYDISERTVWRYIKKREQHQIEPLF